MQINKSVIQEWFYNGERVVKKAGTQGAGFVFSNHIASLCLLSFTLQTEI